MSLSMKDCTLKLFYKNGDCTLAALKKFWSLKSTKKGCDLVSTNGLKKMIKEFKETNSFELKSGTGRNSVCFDSKRKFLYSIERMD